MKWLVLVALGALMAAPLSAQDKAPKISRKPDLISTAEIDLVRSEVTSAYDLIQRLRPNYLRSRGSGSVSGGPPPLPKVVVDGTPRGELDQLRQVPAQDIKEVRYLKAADATTQYGTNYDGGAIVITTK